LDTLSDQEVVVWKAWERGYVLHNKIHSRRYQYSWSKRTGSEPTSVRFGGLFI